MLLLSMALVPFMWWGWGGSCFLEPLEQRQAVELLLDDLGQVGDPHRRQRRGLEAPAGGLDVGGQDELDLVVPGDLQNRQADQGVRVGPQQVDQGVRLGLVPIDVRVVLVVVCVPGGGEALAHAGRHHEQP